ncbi:MAG TPA: hypothetical protein VNV86_00340 [Candidatus Acidoferrum sp.]|jgi:hypothetical protein|nr:hypothetical protein [Candidatus Acidoferrum sp.]
MRFVFAVLISSALLSAGEPQDKKPATQPKRNEIPQGAVEREGRFFYTDSDGKKWIFVRTPFGISKMEDKPSEAPGVVAPTKTTDPFAAVKITVNGDVVSFERPTPFGVSKWKKKLSELDDQEKAAVRRTQEDSTKQASKAGEPSTKQDR